MIKEFISNKNFNNYYFGRNISNIGDIFHDVALTIIVSSYTNSIFISGVLVSINAIVRVLSSLFLIKIIDKLNPKKSMIKLDMLYGFFVLILFLLIVFKFNYFYLFIFEIIFSFIFSIYKIVREKILKSILPSSNKSKYMSFIYTSENTLSVLVPIISVLLLKFISLRYFILINSISFFVSAYYTTRIVIDMGNRGKVKNENTNYDFKYITQIYPYLILIFIIAAVITFISSTSKIIILQFIKEFNFDSKKVGVLQSIFAVGCILGSFIPGMFKDNSIIKNLKKFIFICIAIFIPYILYQSFYTFVIVDFCYGLIFTAINVFLQVYYQSTIKEEHFGFIRSIHTIVVGAIIPLSMFISGYLLNLWTLKILFLIFSVIILSLLVVFYILEVCYEENYFAKGE